MLRTQANEMRLAPITVSPQCLDDGTLAMLASGAADATLGTPTFAHLLECGHCRRELASAARVFADSDVQAELERLAQPVRRRPLSRRAIGGIGAGAIAAALLIVLLRPDAKIRPPARARYREQSFTAGLSPTLVSPIGVAAPTDTFRWRAVERANRYRLVVFSRDGSIAWEQETSDTIVALPGALSKSADRTFLWRVEARVGWEERWAASDMAPLTVTARVPVWSR
jgi:hypothetical protein